MVESKEVTKFASVRLSWLSRWSAPAWDFMCTDPKFVPVKHHSTY